MNQGQLASLNKLEGSGLWDLKIMGIITHAMPTHLIPKKSDDYHILMRNVTRWIPRAFEGRVYSSFPFKNNKCITQDRGDSQLHS